MNQFNYFLRSGSLEKPEVGGGGGVISKKNVHGEIGSNDLVLQKYCKCNVTTESRAVLAICSD